MLRFGDLRLEAGRFKEAGSTWGGPNVNATTAGRTSNILCLILTLVISSARVVSAILARTMSSIIVQDKLSLE